MRVTKIQTTGLKASDCAHDLTEAVVISGENGAGKTTVVEALHLLAFGRAMNPDLPSTNEGVMRLARGDTLEVSARLQWTRPPSGAPDDGGDLVTATVRRRWKRDRKGSVKETIEATGLPQPPGGLSATAARKAQLAHLLGGLTEVWRPGDLLGLSAGKLRSRLLQLIPTGDLERVVPGGLPEWAAREEGQGVLEWIDAAITRGRSRVTDEQRRRRELEAELEDFGDGGDAPPAADLATLQERLGRLQEEARAVERAQGAARRVRDLEERLEGLRARLPAEGMTPEQAEADLAEVERLTAARAMAEGQMASLRTEHRLREQERARLPEGEYPGDGALERAQLDLEAAEELVAAMAEAREKVAREGGTVKAAPPSFLCESCQAAWAAAVEPLRAQWRDADEAFKAASREHEAARRKLALTRQLVDRAQLDDSIAEIERQIAEHEATLAGLPARTDLAERRGRAHAAKARAGLVEDIEATELDLEVARAEDAKLRRSVLEGVETPDIAAATRQVTEQIEALGRAAERRETAADLRQQAHAVEARIAEAQGAVRRLELAQAQALDQARHWLETRLSEVAGEPAQVVLEAEGKPTCRITLGGIDLATKSGGERFRLLAALAVVLAERAAGSGVWRPLIVDSFEAVSAEHRAGFLGAVLEAVRSGRVDQAIIAGCPDHVPGVGGWQLVEVRAQRAREVA